MSETKKRVLPPVDALYWASILAATALGEKLGDLVSMTLRLGYGPSAVLLVAASLTAILLHLATPARSVPLYWAVVVLTSTAGTTLADLVTRSFGLGYAGGSLLLVALLAALTIAWRRLAPSASLEAPMPRRVEAIYWAEMLVAGTLGTASGDFLADDTALGFVGAALVLAALLGALGLLRARRGCRDSPSIGWRSSSAIRSARRSATRSTSRTRSASAFPRRRRSSPACPPSSSPTACDARPRWSAPPKGTPDARHEWGDGLPLET